VVLAVQQCAGITSLNLFDLDISAEAGQALAMALSAMSALKVFTANDCTGGGGVSCTVQALCASTTLREVVVHPCGVARERSASWLCHTCVACESGSVEFD